MDDKDHYRFIYDLFEFNDQRRVRDSGYYFNIRAVGVHEYSIKNRELRKLLVKLHAFCPMPNHYHLLLSSLVENGIAMFMQKLNGGYVQYFNQRHERTGTLFERKYKSVLIDNHAHFIQKKN